ncbi:uncharacterized protein METZ01_LOCUS79652, partial [marine metagenome]
VEPVNLGWVDDYDNPARLEDSERLGQARAFVVPVSEREQGADRVERVVVEWQVLCCGFYELDSGVAASGPLGVDAGLRGAQHLRNRVEAYQVPADDLLGEAPRAAPHLENPPLCRQPVLNHPAPLGDLSEGGEPVDPVIRRDAHLEIALELVPLLGIDALGIHADSSLHPLFG